MRNFVKKWMLLLPCLLLAGVAMSEPLDKDEKLVVGVDVPMLVRKVLGDNISRSKAQAGCRGVTLILTKDGKSIGTIQLGVFADRKTACDTLEEHIRYISVGPNRMGGNIGEKAAVWKRSIIFVRKNVTVLLHMDPPDILMKAGLAIDTALIRGEAGVRLGTSVHMPRILKVELPDKFMPGTDAFIKVYITPPGDETTEGTLSFNDNFGVKAFDLPIANPKHNVEVQDGKTFFVYTARYHVPRQAPGNTVECWVCYATSDCRTTSEKIALTTGTTEH